MAADLMPIVLSALSTIHVATDELADLTGIPLRTVEEVMLKAADQGLVLRLGGDRWELTGAGATTDWLDMCYGRNGRF
ncbi:MAG: hypothetical protein ACE5MI_08100 [Acidimicrobiia bacterium]